jgi:hypothetical protein
MPTMLEIEPEIASKIQARARERGVSIDVYLRELIDPKETESEGRNDLGSQERSSLVARMGLGEHDTNTPLLSDEAISRETIY